MFYNKDYSLTAYSLNCGYIERQEQNNKWIELYREHSTYHVKGYDFNEHNELFWECFNNLTEARKFFYSKLKEVFNLSRIKYLQTKAYEQNRHN